MPQHTLAERLKRRLEGIAAPDPQGDEGLVGRLRRRLEGLGAEPTPTTPERTLVERGRRAGRPPGEDRPAPGSIAERFQTPTFGEARVREPLETVGRSIQKFVLEPSIATSEAIGQVAESGLLPGVQPIPGRGGDVVFDPESPLRRLFTGQVSPEGAGQELLQQLSDRPLAEQIGILLAFDPFNAVPGLGFTRVGSVVPRRLALAAGPEPLKLASMADVAFANPRAPGVAPQAAPVPQRALPPAQGIPLPGQVGPAVTPPRGPAPLSQFEPGLVVVDELHPTGQRLIFRSERDVRRAGTELSQRAGVEVLPADAPPGLIRAAAGRVQPGATQATIRGIARRPGQRAIPQGVDVEEVEAIRRQIRSTESQVSKLTQQAQGKRPNSPVRQRLTARESQLAAARRSLEDLLGPPVERQVEVAGVVRREPASVGRQRVGPVPTSRMLPEPSVAGLRTAPTGGRVARGDIPFEASTPAEAASLRASIRASVDDVAAPEHIENIAAVGRGEVPPDNPVELIQKVSFPEGKPRLSDPPSFAEEVGVGEIRGRIPRLVRALATPRRRSVESIRDFVEAAIRNPIVRAIIRWTPGARNPSLFVENATQWASVVRAALIDDGRQKVSGLTAHARQFGTQDDLFGRTLESTGLLESGPFKGHSVNEIAENPSRFRLNDAQRKWLDTMSGLETEIRDFLIRNGIDVGEVRSANIERFAGRIHVARILADGSIVESGGVGRRGLASRIGAERERVFDTVEAAQKEGFIPLSYEQSFVARAQSAYNRVVNKRTSEWIQRNLPPDVELRGRRPGDPIQFGETVNLPDFPGLHAEGPARQQFIKDLRAMFPEVGDGVILQVARGVNQFNMVQRLFALAGDASIASIQFIILAARHPIVFTRGMKEFTHSLVGATLSPAKNRARRARFLAENAEVIQDSPGLILSESGFEFTESLGRGGFLGPEGVYKGANPILRLAGRIPGTAAAPLRPFQQAFEAAMDDAGVNLMKALRHMGRDDPTRKRAIVDYVNNMRGLSSSARLGLTPNQRLAESVILLAPRYRRAIGALHANVIQGGLRGELARKAYLHLAAGTVAAYTGLSYALGAAQGKSEAQIRAQVKRGLNPTSREFLLWRVGDSAIGVGSKINSDLRLLARIATDPGDVLDFSDFNRNIGVRWVRSQIAAGPSDAWTYLVGSDYLGEPVTRDIFGRPLDTLKSLGKTLRDDVTFLWLQSALFEGGTRDERVLKGGGDFLGMRAYPFPGPSYDDVANIMYGKDFDKLAIPNQRFYSSQQRKVVEEWNKIISDTKRQEVKERSRRKKVARQELEQGIQFEPDYRRRLRELEQRYAP